MTTREERIEQVKDCIESMSESNMIWLHNEYCERESYYDDRIYEYYELNEICNGMTPIEIIEKFGDLTYCNYFKYGVYGAESADWNDVFVDDIAEYCVDEQEDFGDSEIADLLYDFENEDDDEE